MARPEIGCVLTGVALLAAAPATAVPGLLGLDVPEVVLTRTLRTAKTSADSAASPVRHCTVYRAFAILWTADTDIGAKDLVFLARAHGEPPQSLCASGFKGRTVRLDAESDVPVGAVGPYLVAEWPDSFGVAQGFSVYDLDRGKRAFKGSRHLGKPPLFRRSGRDLVIDYWSVLENMVCVPRDGEPGCWERLKKANGIPASAKTAPPDCEHVFAKDASAAKEPRALQIAVHVRMARFSRRDAEYPADAAACDLAP